MNPEMEGYFRAQASAPEGYVPDMVGAPGSAMAAKEASERMQGYTPRVRTSNDWDAEYAAKQMAGYNPENSPNVEVEPEVDLGRGTGGDAGASYIAKREEIVRELDKLQAEYDSVSRRIAEIDKKYPELKDPRRARIAAKRASIGDMSAYDTMAQGRNAGLQTANAIDNALMDAEKLTWALSSQNDEDKSIALNQIEVALRKAERDASQAGTELPSSYYRLRSAYENALGGNSGAPNTTSLLNHLKWKQEKGKLTDADREYIEEELKGKLNSKEYDELMSFWKDSKGKTEEDKAKAKAAKKRRDDWFKSVEGMTPEQQNSEWAKLTQKQRDNVLKGYKWVARKDGSGEYLVRRDK